MVWSDPDGGSAKPAGPWSKVGIAGWMATLRAGLTSRRSCQFIFYGAYPEDQLWRVNLAYIGAVMLVQEMIERLPYRKHVGLLLLTVFPALATVLLTGGGFGLSTTTVGIYTILGLVATLWTAW